MISALLLAAESGWGQTLDSGFNPVMNNYPYVIGIQRDGKILVGGNFTSVGGQARQLARLNPDGTLDNNFKADANFGVWALAVQPDGKVLVAGNFDRLAGQMRAFLGRLNTDGSLDSGFNPAPDDKIVGLAVQPDGKILVGGSFTKLGGQARKFIGRLNADGALDTSFNPEVSGIPSYVMYQRPLVLQPDGKVLVGGNFKLSGGQTVSNLYRLNGDGSFDTTFNTPTANNYGQWFWALQADGKILLAGSFTTLAGQPRNRLARLNADGTLDTSFNFNPGPNNNVSALAVQTDGKILVGGYITSISGQPRNSLARLNADGTLDATFNVGLDGGVVMGVGLEKDGQILLTGAFTSIGGQACTSFARLNNTGPAVQFLQKDFTTLTWNRSGTGPEVGSALFEHSFDGLKWTGLGVGTRIPGGWRLSSVLLPPGGTFRARGYVYSYYYYCSGWFDELMIGAPGISVPPQSTTQNVGTTACLSVGAGGTEPLSYQWYKNGLPLVDEGNISGANTAALSIGNVVVGDGALYSVTVSNAQGTVTSAATLTVLDPIILVQPVSQNRGLYQSAVFSVTPAGTAPFAYQWYQDGQALPQASGPSLTLMNLEEGDAGYYSAVVSNQYGSITSQVAVLTINLSTADSFNPNPDSFLLGAAVQADGKIVMGGYFGSIAGQTRNHIARFYPDGSLDSGFNPGVDLNVYSLLIQNDGKIVVGGRFTTLGGQPRTNIGRLNADGTVDNTFNPGAGAYEVCALALQPDGKILVGGSFSNLAGQVRLSLGRVYADGSLDNAFNANTAIMGDGAKSFSVYSLAVQPDGKILVGGGFNLASGHTRNRICRLNPDGTMDSDFTPGANSSVLSLIVQPNGKIVVGGDFTFIAGEPRRALCRLNEDGTLDQGLLQLDVQGSISGLALQADGKIIAGGNFATIYPTNLVRLNADGTPDLNFNLGANGKVSGLAIQADGKILVLGEFWLLAGQRRECIGRLNNTGPATQSLSYSNSTITWLRGGTSPEVWRTAFELCTDGTTWTSLGAGEWIGSGWRLSGVNIPPGGVIRARGYYATGYYSSGSIVESLYRVGPGLAVQQVGGTIESFVLRGQPGVHYVVESASSPIPSASWAPYCNFTMTNIFQTFTATNNGEAARFFRAKEQ